MSPSNKRYWLLQLVGWVGWAAIIIYLHFVIFSDVLDGIGTKKEYVISLAIFLICGITATHLLRYFIKKNDWLNYSAGKIILLFIISSVVTGTLLYYVSHTIQYQIGYSYDKFLYTKRLRKAQAIEAVYNIDTIDYYNRKINNDTIDLALAEIKKTGWIRTEKGKWKYEGRTEAISIYQMVILIVIWLLIYIIYHYIERNRKNEVDRLKLKSTVKELELKTIKSHINPHFIFNSLNSIRALVDENPARARTAITELSNILRSSMQAEKLETVPLEKEIRIVRDYLAIEQMRFEERLEVEIEIDSNTLEQTVPPMMLQTLVENAIKHGISKKMDGGFIKIIARFNDDNLELIVQNSGQIAKEFNTDGFGIPSTESRLNLLYHDKASFEIKNLTNSIVQSKVTIPVNI